MERNQLSPREQEVLRLAGSGMTDQQIANMLAIRVSTVTTYWVRIRGKVGQLSRAELISLSLRQQSQETMNGLKAEIARLTAEVAQLQAAQKEAMLSSQLLKAALDAMPAGMVIVRPDGGVAISNKAACSLLNEDRRPIDSAQIKEILDGRNRPQRRATEKKAGNLKVAQLEGSGAGWLAVILDPRESAQ